MADTSPLAGLLDRAGHVFSLAYALARDCQQEHEQQRQSGRVDAASWMRHEPAFNGFCAALLEMQDSRQNPPDGFMSIAEVLSEAANVASQIWDVMQKTHGLAWARYLDFWPHLNSVAANGRAALLAVRKAQRTKNPFALLNDPAQPASVRSPAVIKKSEGGKPLESLPAGTGGGEGEMPPATSPANAEPAPPPAGTDRPALNRECVMSGTSPGPLAVPPAVTPPLSATPQASMNLEWYARRRPNIDPSAPPLERVDYWWTELADYLAITHGAEYAVRDGRCRTALYGLAIALVDAKLTDRVEALSDPHKIGGRTPAIDLLKRAVLIHRVSPRNMCIDQELNDMFERVVVMYGPDGRWAKNDPRQSALAHAARLALAHELRDEVLTDPKDEVLPPAATTGKRERERDEPADSPMQWVEPATAPRLHKLLAELGNMVELSCRPLSDLAQETAERTRLNVLLAELWTLARGYPEGQLPVNAFPDLEALEGELHNLFADRWSGRKIPRWDGPSLTPTRERLLLMRRSWPAGAVPATPPPVDPDEETELPKLHTTQVDILKAMLQLKATGQTRKTTREEVAQTINRTWAVAKVSRHFQRLGQLGYTSNGVGPDGGVWLSIEGKRVAELLKAEEK